MVEWTYMQFLKHFTFPSEKDGLTFVSAWMFRQTFQHLCPWATNDRTKALARRDYTYDVFASNLLKKVKEIKIPITDYRTHNMSDGQKLVAPSILISKLKNVAFRENVVVSEVKEEENCAKLQIS